MTLKRVLCPERLRQIPAQFSWIDHRLVRERHIERCDPPALALYLFLVTVGDEQGVSYYADAKGNEKGRVENGVGYVKKNFLNGLDFLDFSAVNPAAEVWLASIANVRIHGETHQRPVDLFKEEQALLRPINLQTAVESHLC